MHTDEYEISFGREISLCRKMIKRLRRALGDREAQYGMTTEAFLLTQEQGGLQGRSIDLENWRKDHDKLI